MLYGAPLLVHAHVNGLSDVRDHVDIISSRVRGLSDTVVVPHGQAQVGVGGPVLGIGAVVPLAVQHILDILYR